MRTARTRKTDHVFIFKASWRNTAMKLRIEAEDIEYAYRKAENMVRKMEGGFGCMSLELIRQEY